MYCNAKVRCAWASLVFLLPRIYKTTRIHGSSCERGSMRHTFHTLSVLQHMCHSPNIRPTEKDVLVVHARHTCNATANACYNQSIGQSKKYFCASSFLARPRMSLCMCESLHLCLHPNICPGRQDYWERDRKANPFPVGEKATGSWSLSGGAAVTQHCQVKSHLPSMLPPSC